jgi:hypothetical protein
MYLNNGVIDAGKKFIKSLQTLARSLDANKLNATQFPTASSPPRAILTTAKMLPLSPSALNASSVPHIDLSICALARAHSRPSKSRRSSSHSSTSSSSRTFEIPSLIRRSNTSCADWSHAYTFMKEFYITLIYISCYQEDWCVKSPCLGWASLSIKGPYGK